MEPNIQLNHTAIIVAVLASFFLGFIWYSFLFNKSWVKEMGHDTAIKPTNSQMFKSLGLNLIGTLLMVWVFAHEQAVWDARTWGYPTNPLSNNAAAVLGAFFTWLGFYLPQDLNKVSFHNKSWKLFAIETGYNFCSLLVAAYVLVLMK